MENLKITNVRLMVLNPYGKGRGDWNLIRIDTDAGIWGFGEAYFGPGLRPVIDTLLAPRLIGENPLDVCRLYSKMWWDMEGIHSHTGMVMSAISGIEVALWDLAGKITGLPVYRLLGGKYRDAVRMYLTGGGPQDPRDYAQCEDAAARIKAEGWTACKIIGGSLAVRQLDDPRNLQPGHESQSCTMTRRDLMALDKVMANMRRAFGDEFDLAVHCHWDMKLRDALKVAQVVAPYQPMWLEDPMNVPFSPAWVTLTANSPVPICTGENLYSRHEFRPFIEQHGTDVVHIDIPKGGGLMEAKRIADMAETHYLSVSFHNATSIVGTVAAAHAAATIRDFGMIERPGHTIPFYTDIVIQDEPLISNGCIRVPQGPGLGVTLNEELVKRHLAPGETWWE
jgi:L-alanine-DL-glutamate epimerase-like enolase superfamily enzyme